MTTIKLSEADNAVVGYSNFYKKHIPPSEESTLEDPGSSMRKTFTYGDEMYDVFSSEIFANEVILTDYTFILARQSIPLWWKKLIYKICKPLHFTNVHAESGWRVLHALKKHPFYMKQSKSEIKKGFADNKMCIAPSGNQMFVSTASVSYEWIYRSFSMPGSLIW